MGFPRRRSLWLKVAVLATAVWVTVCFLLYTEDRAAAVVQQGLAPSGVAAPQQQVANGFVPPAAPFRKETPGNSPSRPKINQAGPEQGNFQSYYHFFFFFFFYSCRYSFDLFGNYKFPLIFYLILLFITDIMIYFVILI